jgi:hypothetical protein
MKNSSAYQGFTALRTSGAIRIPRTPRMAMVLNQTVMTGPNMLPIFAVPCFCSAKRAVSIRAAIGHTQWLNAGAATERPSTAPSTEIAGVMIPSP